MSKIQDVPFITKVIDTLSDELKSGLYDLINGQVKTPVFRSLVNNDYAITEANDKGKVQFVTLETLRGNYTGYLAYNSVYCVLIAFKGNTQALDMLNINVAKHTFAFVNESLSILELRVELEDGKEGVTPTDLGVTNNNIHLAKGTTQIGEGVNLKTLDGNTLIGSGDIDLKTVGGETIVGSGNVGFKTINDQEIVGDGNIVVGEGGTITIDETTSTTSENALMNKTITNTFATKTEVADEYAKQNGFYEDLNAGSAGQLVATKFVEDEVPYNYRTSGGDADIGNRVSERKIVGGTLGWNQLFSIHESVTNAGITFTNNGNGSYTINGTATAEASLYIFYHVQDVIPAGHKLLVPTNVNASNKCYIQGYADNGIGEFVFRGKGIFVMPSTNSDTNSFFRIRIAEGETFDNVKIIPQLFDLTAMFGATIADYIYSLEQAIAGAGVAWFKNYFPKDYYDYNAGTLLSTKASKKTTIGFNQWDEEWELGLYDSSTGAKVPNSSYVRSANAIKVIPNEVIYINAPYQLAVFQYDVNGVYLGTRQFANNTTITIPSDCHYIRFFVNSTSYGTTYNNDICINLSWSGWRNGEYEPYEKHEYDLPDVVLRGIPKLDSDNNLYFDGDYSLPSGETHRRYGVVDLGTLDWYKSTYNRFYSDGLNTLIKAYPEGTKHTNFICAKYVGDTDVYGNKDKVSYIQVGFNSPNVSTLIIKDTTYATAEEFKTAMSGVLLAYELAEETTETTDTYQELQIVNDFGTEEFTCIGYNESTELATTISIPCGHDSDYYNNLRDKLQRLPEMPAVSDNQTNATYVVEYSAITKQCSFTEISTWLTNHGYAVNVIPTAPTTQGTYNLQVSVDENGTPTYSWVSNA